MKKITIHPLSIILWIWLFVVLGFVSATNYLFAILIHEFGHFCVARKLGYKLSKFSVSPYGFSLSYLEQNVDSKDEIKIAIAGPVANIVSSFFVLALWWVFPATYCFLESFVFISAVLALFNFLPCYPLDGGRVFVNLSSMFFTTKTARKITIAFNIVLSVVFLLFFIISAFINFNPTFLLFSIFLIVGILDLNYISKYEKINIFSKKDKNFVKPTIFCVFPDVTIKELLNKISLSKFTLFYLILNNGKIVCISEKTIIVLSKKYSLKTNFNEILKK